MGKRDKQQQFILSADTLFFGRVFVLGDSLVDSGNALGLAEWYDDLPFTALPDGAPTEENGYFDGRFSNGYTFADLIANRYAGEPSEAVFPFGYDDPWVGIPIAPFRGDPDGNSLNFAYGGAQVIRGTEYVSGLDEQQDALRDAVDGNLRGSDLLVITMGGNDVRALAPHGGDPAGTAAAQAQLDAVAAEMIGQLGDLIARGLGTILITGIPDVGLIPRYDVDGNGVIDTTPHAGETSSEAERAAAATEYSLYLDALIRGEVVPALEALGATVHYTPLMNVPDGMGGVLEQGALELVLPNLATLYDTTVETMQADWMNWSQVVFFDQVHPTAQVHAMVGSYIHARMEGVEWVETMPFLTDNDILYGFEGAIGVAGEADVYTVKLLAGQAYTVNVLGIASLALDGSLADATLSIIDPYGNVVDSFRAPSGSDAGLGFDCSMTFMVQNSGIYTLTVGAEGALTGTYEVQVGYDPTYKRPEDCAGVFDIVEEETVVETVAFEPAAKGDSPDSDAPPMQLPDLPAVFDFVPPKPPGLLSEPVGHLPDLLF
ncbi:SGNH/GDSL hydrolase family protein [Qipengyuania sphaerica]|uniref:SGNH/GDSL hydrolase family protein n=1 Tax=Qipengyuania sphaerica TaxID=2867243 RepID=UPI001C88143D|nr:SGNH/GDSL hydrolase family protein [Qipengyuania sphaerica]MBX7541030.1 hypothetical protein [Qipengyuania sphaerica]